MIKVLVYLLDAISLGISYSSRIEFLDLESRLVCMRRAIYLVSTFLELRLRRPSYRSCHCYPERASVGSMTLSFSVKFSYQVGPWVYPACCPRSSILPSHH